MFHWSQKFSSLSFTLTLFSHWVYQKHSLCNDYNNHDDDGCGKTLPVIYKHNQHIFTHVRLFFFTLLISLRIFVVVVIADRIITLFWYSSKCCYLLLIYSVLFQFPSRTRVSRCAIKKTFFSHFCLVDNFSKTVTSDPFSFLEFFGVKAV